MPTVKQRLERLEKVANPPAPPEIRVFWENEIDDGESTIYPDDHGGWIDRASGQPFTGTVICVDYVPARDDDND